MAQAGGGGSGGGGKCGRRPWGPADHARWYKYVTEDHRRDFAALRQLMALAGRLERDYGVRFQITMRSVRERAEVERASDLDDLLDATAAASAGDADRAARALVAEHWPGRMRAVVRAKRLEEMHAVAAEMLQPRRRLSIDGHDYLLGARDKRPITLPPHLRERFFWQRVHARLAGDQWKPRPASQPVVEAPTAPTRTKQAPVVRSAPARQRQRMR